jgi:hypothetical protein
MERRFLLSRRVRAAAACCVLLTPSLFADGPSAEDVIGAVEENLARYQWVNILAFHTEEDYNPPLISLSRMPYERRLQASGANLMAEVLYIRVVVDGLRYDLSFDFFDSLKPEKGARRTVDARPRIMALLAGIFPEQFKKDAPKDDSAE